MKVTVCILLVFIFRSVIGQSSFSYYYPFDSPTSTFRSMLVDRDTILLQGIFLDTVPPYLQGMAFTLVDSSGNLISYQRYFDPNGRDLTYSSLNNMIKLSDGRYLTVGITLQDDALQLIFLTHHFQVDTVFEYFANDQTVQVNWIRNAFELTDGYILFGYAQRLSFATDGQIFRINKNGDLLWRKWYGLNNKDEAFGDAVKYTDSSFVTGSFHKPFPVHGQDQRSNTWIFEVDINGNILNEFVDPDPFSGTSGGLVIDKKKNIYYAGASIIEDMFGQHNALGRIGMLDSSFHLQWKLNFGKNISIEGGLIDMISSGNTLIATGRYIDTSRTIWGTQNTYTTGWTAISSFSGDSICEVIDTARWFSNYGRAQGIFRAMDTLSSGSIIACGEGWFGQQEDTYNEYAWLVKMPNPPCEGLIVSSKEIPKIIHNWKINPNPATEIALIECNQCFFSEPTLFYVYNSLGHMVKRTVADIGVSHITLDLRNLAEGMYIIQSVNKKGHFTGFEKLIIVK